MNFYSLIKHSKKLLLKILVHRGDILICTTGLEQDMARCLVDTDRALSGKQGDHHTAEAPKWV